LAAVELGKSGSDGLPMSHRGVFDNAQHQQQQGNDAESFSSQSKSYPRENPIVEEHTIPTTPSC
jgi:hypothetical protein